MKRRLIEAARAVAGRMKTTMRTTSIGAVRSFSSSPPPPVVSVALSCLSPSSSSFLSPAAFDCLFDSLQVAITYNSAAAFKLYKQIPTQQRSQLPAPLLASLFTPLIDHYLNGHFPSGDSLHRLIEPMNHEARFLFVTAFVDRWESRVIGGDINGFLTGRSFLLAFPIFRVRASRLEALQYAYLTVIAHVAKKQLAQYNVPFSFKTSGGLWHSRVLQGDVDRAKDFDRTHKDEDEQQQTDKEEAAQQSNNYQGPRNGKFVDDFFSLPLDNSSADPPASASLGIPWPAPLWAMRNKIIEEVKQIKQNNQGNNQANASAEESIAFPADLGFRIIPFIPRASLTFSHVVVDLMLVMDHLVPEEFSDPRPKSRFFSLMLFALSMESSFLPQLPLASLDAQLHSVLALYSLIPRPSILAGNMVLSYFNSHLSCLPAGSPTQQALYRIQRHFYRQLSDSPMFQSDKADKPLDSANLLVMLDSHRTMANAHELRFFLYLYRVFSKIASPQPFSTTLPILYEPIESLLKIKQIVWTARQAREQLRPGQWIDKTQQTEGPTKEEEELYSLYLRDGPLYERSSPRPPCLPAYFRPLLAAAGHSRDWRRVHALWLDYTTARQARPRVALKQLRAGGIDGLYTTLFRSLFMCPKVPVPLVLALLQCAHWDGLHVTPLLMYRSCEYFHSAGAVGSPDHTTHMLCMAILGNENNRTASDERFFTKHRPPIEDAPRHRDRTCSKFSRLLCLLRVRLVDQYRLEIEKCMSSFFAFKLMSPRVPYQGDANELITLPALARLAQGRKQQGEYEEENGAPANDEHAPPSCAPAPAPASAPVDLLRSVYGVAVPTGAMPNFTGYRPAPAEAVAPILRPASRGRQPAMADSSEASINTSYSSPYSSSTAAAAAASGPTVQSHDHVPPSSRSPLVSKSNSIFHPLPFSRRSNVNWKLELKKGKRSSYFVSRKVSDLL